MTIETQYDHGIRNGHGPSEEGAQAIIERQARELGALAALLDQERNLRRMPAASALNDLQRSNWDLVAANAEMREAFTLVRDAATQIIAALFTHVGDRNSLIRVIKSLALVDRDWYLNRYKDVVDAGIDPVEHYVDFGFHELRFPSPAFAGVRKS